MPSLDHEAPLAVLRADPGLVATLLREVLGVDLPPFASAEESSADFTQPLPIERRADFVAYLHDGSPERATVMGIIVEIQRARDEDKRWSWPLYAAALHARLRRPICLVVLATSDPVARWAATPISTLQAGSRFVPLVLGPTNVPVVSADRAVRDPTLGVLSALVHGNGPRGESVVLAAFEGLAGLHDDRAIVFFDLIRATIGWVARFSEADMDLAKYEFKSDYYRDLVKKMREEGREEGRLLTARRVAAGIAARRINEVPAEVQARIEACDDVERLEQLIVDLSTAGDPAAVEQLLYEL